jgi:putative transposase
VIVSESTLHPNSAWVEKQADLFVDQTAGRATQPDIIMHDRDTKFSKDFVDTVKKNGMRTNALPITSPNLSGRTERIIGQIKSECLSKFILFGRKHLDHIVAEYVDYFNTRRSHSSRANLPPLADQPEEVSLLRMDQIEVKSYVGGLVKSFERKAA